MGNQQKCDTDLALDCAQFHLHGFAQALVQRAQRFVEQQQFRFTYQGARQRHALALAAEQLSGGQRQRVALARALIREP